MYNNNLEIIEEEEEDDDLFMLYLLLKKRRQPIKNIFKMRCNEGSYNILIERHLNEDEKLFREYCRLNYKQFDFVLSFINIDISSKVPTRRAITPKEKLFLTLRFLATGETYRSLQFSYRISSHHIDRIVKSVLIAISKRLISVLMPAPTESDLKRIAEDFWNKWNFPNCVGAIDGKHVRLKCPYNSGSLCYNYKKFFSIVLFGLIDANKKFTVVDVGCYGKEGDSGIYLKSTLGKKIMSNQFNIPQPAKLPRSDITLPHVIVGDGGFALDRQLMRPYTLEDAKKCSKKATFNYRLSRARRVSENAFGLLAQIFRIYYTPIHIDFDTIDYLVTATCCLHNLLRNAYLEKNGVAYHAHDLNDVPVHNMIPLSNVGGFVNADGFDIRNSFKEYFVSRRTSVMARRKSEQDIEI